MSSSYITHLVHVLTDLTSTRLLFFFFNDTATTEIYTLSLHDALPIFMSCRAWMQAGEWVEISIPSFSGVEQPSTRPPRRPCTSIMHMRQRSEEHTAELQSRQYLVCRLLLEKKKQSFTTCPAHTLHI